MFEIVSPSQKSEKNHQHLILLHPELNIHYSESPKHTLISYSATIIKPKEDLEDNSL